MSVVLERVLCVLKGNTSIIIVVEEDTNHPKIQTISRTSRR